MQWLSRGTALALTPACTALREISFGESAGAILRSRMAPGLLGRRDTRRDEERRFVRLRTLKDSVEQLDGHVADVAHRLVDRSAECFKNVPMGKAQCYGRMATPSPDSDCVLSGGACR